MTPFTVITEGLRFPEGPIALGDGTFLVVEIAGQALTRIFPDGAHQVVAELEGGPNGAAMGPDGWCYICNSGGWIYETMPGGRRPIGQAARGGWIERVLLETGACERLYEGLNSPNDIVFDDHGGFWFTDLGKRRDETRDIGNVYHARADGSGMTCVLSGLYEPNGIGLSPDGGSVYVAETPLRRVLAFDLVAPGKPRLLPWPAPAGGRVVAALGGLNSLDSMAIDSAGMICVASLNNGGIWELAPDGSSQVHHPLPDFYTTNICFGGVDMRTAYATLSMSGKLVAFDWPRPGLRLRHC